MEPQALFAYLILIRSPEESAIDHLLSLRQLRHSIVEEKEIRFLDEGGIGLPGAFPPPVGFLSDVAVINLVKGVGPLIGTAIGAWLHARYGRKVRLKVGEIEAEAQTVAEMEKLLERAREIQQRNQQPKVIP